MRGDRKARNDVNPTIDLGDEFARETGALTARRWKIGLTLYLLFAALGGLVEWQHYPERGSTLLLSYALQGVIVVGGWIGMRGRLVHPGTAWIALGTIGAIALVTAVFNVVVRGDMLYVLLTFLGFMLVSSVFMPWGAWFQVGADAAIIAAYGVGVAGGARPGPVPAYDGIAIAAVTVFSVLGAHYIDEYRRQLFGQAAAVRETNVRLQRASQARTELISGLSHDMRSPLDVLIGYADILTESPALAEELRAPVRSIRREAGELLALVDGVLDVARLEAGRLPVERSAFLLAQALDPLRETTEDALRAGPVRLRWQMPPELSLDSDPAKVRAVVRNLLSNAVTYTQQGEIRVAAAPADGGVEITVADTGVGIAAEQVERIFDQFHRAEPAAEGSAGIGFGLYMVKLLVQVLGGRIEVQSAPAAGSTFRVWLPLRPPVPEDG